MATPDLVTTAEAAEIGKTSVATITRLALAGELVTYTKAPGKRGARMFRRVDVERYFERNTVRPRRTAGAA